MRTTLNIDDDILEAARSIAAARNLPVGAVLSELARSGLRQATTIPRERKGLPVFDVSYDSTPLTLARVKRFDQGP